LPAAEAKPLTRLQRAVDRLLAAIAEPIAKEEAVPKSVNSGMSTN
jgi:hypothetical protein